MFKEMKNANDDVTITHTEIPLLQGTEVSSVSMCADYKSVCSCQKITKKTNTWTNM